MMSLLNNNIHGAYPHIDPDPILQTAFAFWSSKVFLTAVEFDVFTTLADRRMTGAELGAELGLHPRAVSDFFDTLVAMRFLERKGDGPSAKYFNTPASALYLDRRQPRYIGGVLVMLNARLFKFWHDLPGPCALEGRRMRSSMAERESSRNFTKTPQTRTILSAMAGLSRIEFEAFAAKFIFPNQDTL
jgi:hypothetical protein